MEFLDQVAYFSDSRESQNSSKMSRFCTKKQLLLTADSSDGNTNDMIEMLMRRATR
jgi:hypothetical protein